MRSPTPYERKSPAWAGPDFIGCHNSAIAGAISALKGATDIAKAMIDLRDGQIIQANVIELQGKILEAQNTLFSANDERAALIERIREAEKKITSLEAWSAEKHRYQLTDIGEGSFAYTLKQSVSEGEPAHYICANCYQQSKKAILHHMHTPGGAPNTRTNISSANRTSS